MLYIFTVTLAYSGRMYSSYIDLRKNIILQSLANSLVFHTPNQSCLNPTYEVLRGYRQKYNNQSIYRHSMVSKDWTSGGPNFTLPYFNLIWSEGCIKVWSYVGGYVHAHICMHMCAHIYVCILDVWCMLFYSFYWVIWF